MLKQILEEAIRKAELAREQKEREAKDRVTREKIIPFNAEIDKSRNEAIAQLQTRLDKEITNLKQKFEVEKATLIEAGEKKKADNASIVIEAEIAMVSTHYGNVVAGLRKQLEIVKE